MDQATCTPAEADLAMRSATLDRLSVVLKHISLDLPLETFQAVQQACIKANAWPLLSAEERAALHRDAGTLVDKVSHVRWGLAS